MAKFARLYPDILLERYNYAARPIIPVGTYPAPVPIGIRPIGIPKDNTPLNEEQWAFVEAINDPSSYKSILVPSFGWSNQDEKPDSLSFAHNLVMVIGEGTDGAKQLEKHLSANPVPDWRDINFYNTPWLISLMTAVTPDGRSVLCGSQKYAMTWMIGKSSEWYLEGDRPELFPELPLEIAAYNDMNVRGYPHLHGGFNVSGILRSGEKASLVDYIPRGAMIWGRIIYEGGAGYVALQGNSGTFYTSWKLKSPGLPLIYPGTPATYTYPNVRNQDVINAFYRGGDFADPWMALVNSGLEYLAVPSYNRYKPYTGPRMGELPILTDVQAQSIQSQIQQGML